MSAQSSAAAPEVQFPSIPGLPKLASCSVDGPAATLDWLLSWEAEVQAGGQTLRGQPTAQLLREVASNPAQYGVSEAGAQAALQRFAAQAGQALEAAGGDPRWLEKELGLTKSLD